MQNQRLRVYLLVGALLILSFQESRGQSLKPEAPYPLQPGINKGTSDSLVGTHYWYFYGMPGSSRVVVRMRTPTTLYGTELRNNAITVTLYDSAPKAGRNRPISSRP